MTLGKGGVVEHRRQKGYSLKLTFDQPGFHLQMVTFQVLSLAAQFLHGFHLLRPVLAPLVQQLSFLVRALGSPLKQVTRQDEMVAL
ncbi:hypothetical protein ACO9S2_14890 [Nitrospira sp. NS4]|uniref:hypothetical protein n=1 Tax=Nitrospira sp. NS4 TaxID=3414498 RepID=UPI003C3088FD